MIVAKKTDLLSFVYFKQNPYNALEIDVKYNSS